MTRVDQEYPDRCSPIASNTVVANKPISICPPTKGPARKWTFDSSALRFRGDIITVSMAAPQIVAGGRACRSAIGLGANVIVEAWTCLWVDFPIGTARGDPSVAGQNAEELVAAMLDKERKV